MTKADLFRGSYTTFAGGMLGIMVVIIKMDKQCDSLKLKNQEAQEDNDFVKQQNDKINTLYNEIRTQCNPLVEVFKIREENDALKIQNDKLSKEIDILKKATKPLDQMNSTLNIYLDTTNTSFHAKRLNNDTQHLALTN